MANSLQDNFLNTVRTTKTPVTLYLMNGVKLLGVITWFDNFSLLLMRNGHAQLVYKHAVSTIQPNEPLRLPFDASKKTTDNDEEALPDD